MAYEEKRKSMRDDKDKKHSVKKREDDTREERWDSQDDGDFRYTDWASI